MAFSSKTYIAKLKIQARLIFHGGFVLSNIAKLE